MKNPRLPAYIALLTTTVIWGAALPIVKPSLSFITPYQFLFLRYLIASALSFPILIYLLIKFRPTLQTLLIITLMEILQIPVGLTLLYEGLKHTTSLESALISTASPIFTTIGGIIFLKEHEERHELIGLILSFAGITVITLQPILTGFTHLKSISFTGNFLVLAYDLAWTAYVLLAKKYYRHVPKILIGFISPWIGLVSLSVILFLTSQLSSSLITTTLTTPPVLLATTFMGILGSIVAVPAIIYGNNLIEASEASLFTYLQPAVYIPLAVLWLKEPAHPAVFIGLFLILTGVILAEKRFRTKKQKD